MSKPIGYVLLYDGDDKDQVASRKLITEPEAVEFARVLNSGVATGSYTVEPVGAAPTDAGLREALEALRCDYPDGKGCWCQMSIGNPMIRDHSEGCKRARAALSQGCGG